jgi:hypothetical protein
VEGKEKKYSTWLKQTVGEVFGSFLCTDVGVSFSRKVFPETQINEI